MSKLLPLAAILTTAIVMAQPAAQPVWQTLLNAPVPVESLPNISVVTLPIRPAPEVPAPIGAGDTHPGPVFAYILQGNIENQVEPDTPHFYQAGDVFYEAPLHVHRFLRNRSTTEPASVLVFQEGADKTKANPAIKVMIEESLPSTVDQQVALFRLTLPAGVAADGRRHSGPGFIYVLEGKVTTGGVVHNAGDLFLEPASATSVTYKNVNGSEPAKLLLYDVDTRPSGK